MWENSIQYCSQQILKQYELEQRTISKIKPLAEHRWNDNTHCVQQWQWTVNMFNLDSKEYKLNRILVEKIGS